MKISLWICLKVRAKFYLSLFSFADHPTSPFAYKMFRYLVLLCLQLVLLSVGCQMANLQRFISTSQVFVSLIVNFKSKTGVLKNGFPSNSLKLFFGYPGCFKPCILILCCAL